MRLCFSLRHAVREREAENKTIVTGWLSQNMLKRKKYSAMLTQNTTVTMPSRPQNIQYGPSFQRTYSNSSIALRTSIFWELLF